MKTRTGKIARLPKQIREQLNCRLQDGEQGKDLVQWLNGLPEVKSALDKQFGGRLITEQNLSEWKAGGYEDWLRQEESCERIRRLFERAEGLENAAGDMEISDWLGSLVAAELADALEKLDAIADPKERCRLRGEISREYWLLRKGDYTGQRVRLQRHQWEDYIQRRQEEDMERMDEKDKKRLRSIVFWALKKSTYAELFGGGEQGERMADLLHRIEFDLPIPPTPPAAPANGNSMASSDQTESDLIQPNQTN